jgi:hypothetical protein
MGSYTDFFVTDLAGLRSAFVGWKRPAAEPVPVEQRNPFTGEMKTIPRWVPDPTDTEVVAPRPGETLGQRLEGFPSVALKNVDVMKLADLVAVGIGDGESPSDWIERLVNAPPLVSPDAERPVLLLELPAAFVRALVGWSAAERQSVAEQWAEAILASTGDEWSAEDCAAVIGDLAKLAAQADDAPGGKRLYYWA